jgi:hypothetical protein
MALLPILRSNSRTVGERGDGKTAQAPLQAGAAL